MKLLQSIPVYFYAYYFVILFRETLEMRERMLTARLPMSKTSGCFTLESKEETRLTRNDT